MKDLILYAIVGAMFILNVWSLWDSRKENNSVYRIVYLTRHWDWLLALLIVIFILTFCGLIYPYVPEFLGWSWFSLLGRNNSNANTEIFYQAVKFSPYTLLFLFVFFAMLLPKAAYWEEKRFRDGRIWIRQTILVNVWFGLLHCIVGIPIWVGLVVGLVGFFFSLKYIWVFRKSKDMDIALDASTSLHAKYNMILITGLTLILFLTSI